MDKQVTKWARLGYTSVLMFGRRWPLQRDKTYRVRFDVRRPAASVIEEVD